MQQPILTLQSLRFVFIFLVFLSHVPSGFDAGGVCGVSLFFVLSGFVLSEGYGERVRTGQLCWRQFFFRRWARIYPLHLLGALLFLVAYRQYVDPSDWPYAVCNLALVQSWVPLHDCYFSLNGLSWFLSSILLAYAMFPCIWRVVNACRLRTAMIFALIIAGVYVGVVACLPDSVTEAWLYVFPPVRLLDFSLGVLCHRVYRHVQASGGLRHAALWEWLPVVLFAGNVVVSPYLPERFFYVAQFWPTAAATVLVFALADSARAGWLTRGLRLRFMVALGSISFEFYLLHAIWMEIMVYVFFRLHIVLPAAVQYTAVFLLLLPICWTVHRMLRTLTSRLLR